MRFTTGQGRRQVLRQLTDVLEQLAEPAGPQSPIRIDSAWVEHLVSRSVLDYEPHHGGFGGAPQVPA